MSSLKKDYLTTIIFFIALFHDTSGATFTYEQNGPHSDYCKAYFRKKECINTEFNI